MNTKRIIAVGTAAMLAAVVWMLWPADEPVAARPAERPVVKALKKRIEKNRAKLAARPLPVPIQPEVVEGPSEQDVEDEGFGRLVIDVVDEEGRSQPGTRVSMSMCQWEMVEEGVYSAEAGQRCMVQAWRRDGALFARSNRITWTAEPGREEYLQLEVPTARTGGLGVQVDWAGDAIVVRRVFPGTPAARQGLEAGDRITVVDGIPVTQLGLHGFIEKMTGPEGTDVSFMLSYEDEQGPVEEELVITREAFDS